MNIKNTKLLFSFLMVVLLFIFVPCLSADAVSEDDIESISVEKVILIKNYDGEVVSENGADYFRYDTAYPSMATVRFKNGDTLSDSFSGLEAYFGKSASFTDSQSAESPWKEGSYKAQFTFLGYTGEYDVEIRETPVEKIVIKEVALLFKGDGYYDELSLDKAFYYDSTPREMTVYFKDGTIKSGTADSFFELTGYPVEVYDNQETAPWSIGRYKCRACYMGVNASYYVTVKESPVKSLLVDGVTLYEGIDGFYGRDFMGGGYDYDAFYYNAKPDKITVFYKDGTALTGSVEEIEKETGYRVTYDTQKKWSHGKQTASVSFLGASTKFVANVKANPIKKVTLSKNPVKTDYYVGELFDFYGSKIRVEYNSGKTEEAELLQNYESGSITCRLGTIGKTVELNGIIEIGDGDEELYIDFSDADFAVDIKVKEEKLSKIELYNDENGFPALKFFLSDGSKKTTPILNTVYGNFNELPFGSQQEAIITTNLGDFRVSVQRMLEGYRLSFGTNGGEAVIDTNYCKNMNWAESAMTERARLVYNFFGKADAYSGLVSSDNIDALLFLAVVGSDKGKAREIHESYRIYTSTEIQKSVIDFFDIDGIDISLSKKFDTKTNTVRIDIPDNVYRNIYFYEKGVSYPVKYKFADGFFMVTYTFSDGKTMELCADSLGRVASYKVNEAVLHKHVMVTIPGTAPTYLKTGLTDGVKCSSCGEVLTEQKSIAKLVLGRTSKIVAEQTTSSITLSWSAVKGATGYEIYYKTPSTSWKSLSTTTKRSISLTKRPSGKTYSFAVKAYVTENGKLVKAKTYTSIETATKPLKPKKITAKYNSSAIRLSWTEVSGATGYRVYRKTTEGWKRLGSTKKTSVTFRSLKSGTKIRYAIKPYVKTKSGVIWCDSYIAYTASTRPATPSIKASSPSKGTASVTFGKVNGAEVYQLYYKVDGGKYKLYKNYSSAKALKIGSLKSGKTYVFSVRSAIKTSGGWIYSPTAPVFVTVK